MKLVVYSDWFRVYENVLSKEYCDKIIKYSEPLMINQPLHGTEKLKEGHPQKDWRTSNQCFIDKSQPIINELDKAASTLTKISINNFEKTSVIRYKKGQEYKGHFDFFDEGKQEYYDKAISFGGNRIATALFYLSDEFEGGETSFLRCDNLTIKPKKGMCIIWQNMIDTRAFGDKIYKPNMASYHAGLPVKSGEKWIATKWIRENTCTM